ncbi:MAG TPA: type VII secretion-associated protein [Pseudonocardia sp.]|nr:type VII secretion-associated protein [Pseudonocardia sp.]
MRVSLRLGGERLRVAIAQGPGGRCRVLTVGGRPASPTTALGRVLAGRAPDELVLVHPAGWTPARVRRVIEEFGGLARRVTACPAAPALARELAARTTAPPGPVAIVEVDADSVSVTVLAGLTDQRVLAVNHGAPDAAVSVLEQAAREAGVAVARLTGAVVLTGVARGLLIERIGNVAGSTPALVADAEVLSALGGLRPGALAGPAPDFRPASPLDHPRADALGRGLPGPRRSRRLSRVAWRACGPVLWGLLSGTLVAALSNATPRSAPVSARPPPGVLAQYDYTATLPAGWQHSGGLPALRRTLLTPVAAPRGSDVISIEQTLLGYDSSAEPDRALREFTARYRAAVAAGDQLDRFTLSQRVGGRDVLAYRQRQPARGAEVQWYVIFVDDLQLSVGCQHTPRGTGAVGAACATVVASLRTTGETR